MASTPILLLLLAAAAVAGPHHAGATEYAVGDSDGWTIGPNFLDWSQKYNFTTSDTLAFNYVPGQHDVYRVTRDAFQSCEPAAGQTVRRWATGRDVVDLAATGDYYFICNVTGHCLGGMKFSIAVGVPPPPPPSPPPPPPSFPTTAPPPPSSGASLRGWRLALPDLARMSCLAVIGLWISLLSCMTM